MTVRWEKPSPVTTWAIDLWLVDPRTDAPAEYVASYQASQVPRSFESLDVPNIGAVRVIGVRWFPDVPAVKLTVERCWEPKAGRIAESTR